MNKYMQGIGGKFSFILTFFTLQIVSIFFVTQHLINKVKMDEVVIKLVARQDLLTQNYVKFFFYFLETKKIKDIQDVIKEFDQIATILSNNSKLSPAEKEKLSKIANDFKALKNTASSLLGAQGEEKKKSYDLVIEQSQNLSKVIDELHSELDHKSKLNFTLITNVEIGLMIFSLMMVCLILVFVNKKIIKIIAANFNKINELSSNVNNQIMNVEKNTINMQKNSDSMTRSFSQTMEAVTEISKISQNSANLSVSAMDFAKNSMDNAEKGKHSMENFMEKMGLISESNQGLVKEIENANREISSIVDDVNKISEQTKIINDIAFQSKLLSFNASVEAARAGEHGQGFSVVANEIGNFAKASDISSKEITKLLTISLEKIRSKIDDNQKRISDAMKNTKKHIEDGHDRAKYCLEIFQNVAHEGDKVGELTNTVAQSNGEVLEGINQIKNAMYTITNNDGQSNYQKITQEILESVVETKNDNKKMLESMNEFSDIILGNTEK